MFTERIRLIAVPPAATAQQVCNTDATGSSSSSAVLMCHSVLLQSTMIKFMDVNRLHMRGTTHTPTLIHSASRGSTGATKLDAVLSTTTKPPIYVASFLLRMSNTLTIPCRLVLQQSWVPGMNGAPPTHENHGAWCGELDVSLV